MDKHLNLTTSALPHPAFGSQIAVDSDIFHPILHCFMADGHASVNGTIAAPNSLADLATVVHKPGEFQLLQTDKLLAM